MVTAFGPASSLDSGFTSTVSLDSGTSSACTGTAIEAEMAIKAI
jgi:hypothetical protein